MAGTRERAVAGAVAEELRALLARRQLDALSLARSSGIPNSTLDTLLKGTAAMDVDQLARICRALEIEPGDLLTVAIARIPNQPGEQHP